VRSRHPYYLLLIISLSSFGYSVDVHTDETMQQIVRSEFHDCTVIAIAHRIDTVLDFDRIAVFNNGSMVEFDTPLVLLSRPSALKDLYEQLRG
jgi:ATP-binding cassette subfamily C (CFTR/MRP) protein 1